MTAPRSAADEATAALQELATKSVNEYAATLVLEGTHEWQWDPQVPEVVGLIEKGSYKAAIVIYLADQDFECSREFEAKAL